MAIWTGTYYQVELIGDRAVCVLTEEGRKHFNGHLYFGGGESARASEAYGRCDENGRFVQTATGADTIIKAAQQRDDEAGWVVTHPGTLADATAERDPFVPDDLPADS